MWRLISWLEQSWERGGGLNLEFHRYWARCTGLSQNESLINRGAPKPLRTMFEAIVKLHGVPGVPRQEYQHWGCLYFGVPIGGTQSGSTQTGGTRTKDSHTRGAQTRGNQTRGNQNSGTQARGYLGQGYPDHGYPEQGCINWGYPDQES